MNKTREHHVQFVEATKHKQKTEKSITLSGDKPNYTHTHTAGTSSYMFRVVHTHTPRLPSSEELHQQMMDTDKYKHTCIHTDRPRGSYSDAEQGSPDGSPSVQSSVDDQDETLS